MVSTGTPDTRVKINTVSSIYEEEFLLGSDYKNFLPSNLYETTTQVDEVLGINSTSLAKNGEYITWVTTITRIQ